jgi:F-type H+-transporting ATPase subunit b
LKARALAVLLAAACAGLPARALAAGGEGGDPDFFWRVANFALLLAVLVAVTRKPIRAFFSERTERIRGEVESAARLRHEAEERHARLQRKLAELDLELAQIRDAARERAESEREHILADARKAAARLQEDARVAIEQQLRRAREELRQEAAQLAVELAGGILEQELRPADHARLVDEFIESVERAAAQGPGR